MMELGVGPIRPEGKGFKMPLSKGWPVAGSE